MVLLIDGTTTRRDDTNILSSDGQRTEPPPINHQQPALLEQVTTAVRRLDLAADRVRQRHFDHLVIGALDSPVPEG